MHSTPASVMATAEPTPMLLDLELGRPEIEDLLTGVPLDVAARSAEGG